MNEISRSCENFVPGSSCLTHEYTRSGMILDDWDLFIPQCLGLNFIGTFGPTSILLGEKFMSKHMSLIQKTIRPIRLLINFTLYSILPQYDPLGTLSLPDQ